MVLLGDSIAETSQWVLYLGSPGSGSQLAVPIASSEIDIISISIFNFVLFLSVRLERMGFRVFAW
jgi:hypothetical protein